MTLRDWFAGQVLSGITYLEEGEPMDPIVDDADRFADMMLERRKR